MNARLAMHLVVGLLLLSLAACKGDPIGHTVPVKGKVTVDGKALTKGSVTFWPNKDKGNNSPHEAGAPIGEDGTYEVFTKGKPGVPPGHYKVTVTAQVPSDPKNPYSAPKLLVPQKYTEQQSTPFLIEVVETPGPNAYDLAVKW
jgi:hypothetical protein